MNARTDFTEAYRAVRIMSHHQTMASFANLNPLMVPHAIRACYWRTEHRGGVECAKSAPDYRMAIDLNLTAARYRRATGWARKRAMRLAKVGG